MPTIVQHFDKKTGKTRVYESTPHYDPVTKQSRPNGDGDRKATKDELAAFMRNAQPGYDSLTADNFSMDDLDLDSVIAYKERVNKRFPKKHNFVVVFYRNLRDKWNTKKVGIESQKVGVESQKVGVHQFVTVLKEDGIREKEEALEDFYAQYASLEFFGRKDIMEELQCSTTTGDKIIRCLKASEMIEAVNMLVPI